MPRPLPFFFRDAFPLPVMMAEATLVNAVRSCVRTFSKRIDTVYTLAIDDGDRALSSDEQAFVCRLEKLRSQLKQRLLGSSFNKDARLLAQVRTLTKLAESVPSPSSQHGPTVMSETIKPVSPMFFPVLQSSKPSLDPPFLAETTSSQREPTVL